MEVCRENDLVGAIRKVAAGQSLLVTNRQIGPAAGPPAATAAAGSVASNAGLIESSKTTS